MNMFHSSGRAGRRPDDDAGQFEDDLAGKHSVRSNDQWRIVFRWTDTGPEDVDVVDCHRGRTGAEHGTKEDAAPVHPSEVLREDDLVPMKLTAYALAKIEPRAA